MISEIKIYENDIKLLKKEKDNENNMLKKDLEMERLKNQLLQSNE